MTTSFDPKRARTESVEDVLRSLEEVGVDLWLDGDRLRFRAPKGVMNDARKTTLRAHKQAIIDRLRGVSVSAIDPTKRHIPFPLTELQQAYLIGRGSTIELGNIGSHVYLEARVEGFDRARAEAAWRTLITHHDMLRAVLLEGGQPSPRGRATWFGSPSSRRTSDRAARGVRV